jgi:hypothetical protein
LDSFTHHGGLTQNTQHICRILQAGLGWFSLRSKFLRVALSAKSRRPKIGFELPLFAALTLVIRVAAGENSAAVGLAVSP